MANESAEAIRAKERMDRATNALARETDPERRKQLELDIASHKADYIAASQRG